MVRKKVIPGMSTRMNSQRKINKLDIFTNRLKDRFATS